MKKNVRETVKEAILPTVTELGYRLWDVTYSKVGADYHLEITIDSERGINIEDCEKVHRAIDPILDELDPIETFYYLDVSSPGIERELKNDAHIAACTGWDVEVRLYAPLDGAKSYTGTLVGLDGDGNIAVACAPGGEVRTFARASVAALRTTYDFDNNM